MILEVVTIITAVAALITANAALKSARNTSNLISASLLDSVLKDYANRDMLNSMKSLQRFKKLCENTNKLFDQEFRELEKSDEEKYDNLDADRRRFFLHFYRIYRLNQAKLITDDLIKKMVYPDEVIFLFNTILPLVKSKALSIELPYDNELFTKFKKIFKNDDDVKSHVDFTKYPDI